MRVFVTGGTGLVGSRLIRKLRARGDEVLVLSRRPDAWQRVGQDCMIVTGDPTQPGDWQDRIAECDAVVNLAGENIFARRWTPEFKELLRMSRLLSTSNVVAALAKNALRADGSPKVLVNASAIGFYGPCGDEEIDELSPAGHDFLAGLCVEWEAAARLAESAGVRVVLVRIGVVLDLDGGALAMMITPFKLGAGGPVGSGKQIMSWIHHADMTGLLLLALDHSDARGPLNGTAPNPVTNKEFGKALGKTLGRPAFMPTPRFALKLLLGEVADVLATGQRVVPKKALALSYPFSYPDVGLALRDILRR